MELEVEKLITALSDEEENIKEKLISLQTDGILDEPLEKFLTSSIDEIRSKKLSIQKEFSVFKEEAITESQSKCTKIMQRRNLNISEFVDFENTATASNQQIRRKEKVESSQPLKADEIFRKKISPLRGNSPSAMRYSPQLSPASTRTCRSQNFDQTSRESPFCSTRSSTSSVDKITKDYRKKGGNNDKLYKKYQELREIKNRAHEEMLILKEKMLLEKELQLEKMIKQYQIIEKKEFHTAKTLNVIKNVKPPRSPKVCTPKVETEQKDDKVKDLLNSIFGIPQSKVSQFATLINSKQHEKIKRNEQFPSPKRF